MTPVDEAQAARIRAALGERAGLTEKRMFGGLGWMLHGNMAVGLHGEELIVRVPPERTGALLRKPHAKPFTLGPAKGKGMKGWLLVGPGGWRTGAGLRGWVAEGVSFAEALPRK